MSVFLDLWIYIAMSVCFGVMEAGIFAHGGANTKWPYNIHRFLMIPRIIMGLGLMTATAMAFSISWNLVLLKGVSYVAMFPFLHDGAYHQTRGLLDVPGDNFFSYRDGNAIIDLDFPFRLILFVFGLLFYIITTETWENLIYFSSVSGSLLQP